MRVREIKFRAWDNKNSKMVEIDGSDLYIADGEIYNIYEVSGYQPYMKTVIVTDQYELIQYTGIKDKNGKEIYEADIVQVKLKDETELFEVAYNDEKARFELVDYLGDTWSFDNSTEIVVMGNMYENRYLIE